jgi:hypothetical protein
VCPLFHMSWVSAWETLNPRNRVVRRSIAPEDRDRGSIVALLVTPCILIGEMNNFSGKVVIRAYILASTLFKISLELKFYSTGKHVMFLKVSF